jgi:1,4-dihydroxy-2-naphthoyl-CoA hydrolase
MAPNGYMHAASIIFLADTAAGFASFAHLPPGNKSLTTIELKSNFISTAKAGDIVYCTAELRHGGSRTHVWDAEVYRYIENSSGEKEKKLMALFRCTQAITDYKKPALHHNEQTK